MSRRALNRVPHLPSSQLDDGSHQLSDLSTVPKHHLLRPTCRQPSNTMSTKCRDVHPAEDQLGKKNIFCFARHLSIKPTHQHRPPTFGPFSSTHTPQRNLAISCAHRVAKAPPTKTYLSTTILQRVNKMSRRALNRVPHLPSSQLDDGSHQLSDLSTVPKHHLLGPTCRQPSNTMSTKCRDVHQAEGQKGERPRPRDGSAETMSRVPRRSCQKPSTQMHHWACKNIGGA